MRTEQKIYFWKTQMTTRQTTNYKGKRQQLRDNIKRKRNNIARGNIRYLKQKQIGQL